MVFVFSFLIYSSINAITIFFAIRGLNTMSLHSSCMLGGAFAISALSQVGDRNLPDHPRTYFCNAALAALYLGAAQSVGESLRLNTTFFSGFTSLNWVNFLGGGAILTLGLPPAYHLVTPLIGRTIGYIYS